LIYRHIFQFLTAAAFSIIIETTVLILLYKYLKISESRKKLIIAGILATGGTIPYVWFIFPVLSYTSYFLYVVVAEIFAFVVEALFYRIFLGLDYKKAFIFSFLCNSASFGAGLLILNKILKLLI
jgi:hypothetical protein